jgi:hypothetical protein
MRAGQVQAGRVDKHVKPLVARVILVVNPSTRGFAHLSHQLSDLQSRLEKAQCRLIWHQCDGSCGARCGSLASSGSPVVV